MKYTIEFRCGHSGDVHLIGKRDYRDWKVEQLEQYGLCEDCYKKQKEKEREEANKKAQEEAKELELPDLTGTEGQITWAITLRQKYVDYFCKDKEDFEIIDYIINHKIEAKWYIDSRNMSLATIREDIKREIKDGDKKAEEKKMLKDIEAELTVFPENSIDKEPVKIVIKDDYIRLYFHKDDNFIKFVKSENYKWDYVWERKINWLAGNILDRAKEIGNKLLNEGYGIIAPTKEILDGAIKGEYEKEITRWILNRKDTDLLAIWWRDKDDNLYSKARKITSSKWSSPSVTVKKEHYSEVLDFAEMNNFYVAESALKLIEKYKESIKIVKPIEVKKEILEDDKIEKILYSDRNILDDLKDD